MDLVILGEQVLLRQRRLLRHPRLLALPLPGTVDDPAWERIMALLPGGARGRLHVYLPSSAFLFWRLPWLDAALDEPALHQLAASVLKEDFGRSVEEMAVSLSPPRFRQARLACGLSRATVSAVAAATPSGLALAGIYPLLSQAWPRLSRATRPLLYSEPGLAALCLPDSGGPQLHTRRLPAGRYADAGTAAAMAALFGIAVPPCVSLRQAGSALALSETPPGPALAAHGEVA